MHIYTSQADRSTRIFKEPILTLIEKLHSPKHKVIPKCASVMHDTALE